MIEYPDSFLHIKFYDALSALSPTRNLAMQIKVATATTLHLQILYLSANLVYTDSAKPGSAANSQIENS